MTILRRYILGEVLRASGLAAVVYGVVIFISYTLAFLGRGLTLWQFVRIAPAVGAQVCIYMFPMALLTGSLLCYGRLSADNEILAVCSSGIHVWRVVSPAVVLGVFLSAAMVLVHDSVIPSCQYRMRKMRREVEAGLSYRLLDLGRTSLSIPGGAIHVGGRDGRVLKDVVVVQADDGAVRQVVTAGEAEIFYDDEEDVALYYLRDTAYVDFGEGKPVFGSARTQVRSVPLPARKGVKMGRRFREMRFRELLKKARESKDQNERLDAQTEFHRRLSLSFAGLVFVLVGVPLGIMVHRADRLAGFGISMVLVLVVYYPFTVGGEELADMGLVAPWFAMWSGNMVLGALGSALMASTFRK